MERRELIYLAILLIAVVGYPRLRKALLPETADVESQSLDVGEDHVPDDATIESFLEDLETGTFPGVDGVPIAYAVTSPQEIQHDLVLVPGFTESYLKYGEELRLFTSRGYRVFVLDHRGMGLSGRLGSSPQVVHVERFRDYVDDLETFLSTIVLPRTKGPIDLLAHSTGGLIAAFVLKEHSDWFRRSVLSAPLMGIVTSPAPEWLAYAVAWGLTKLGNGKDYPPWFGDFDPERDAARFERVTGSKARIRHQIKILKRHPEILMGGPSNGWVVETIAATRDVKPLAREITQAILLLQADTDHYSRLTDQEEFCKSAPNCRLVRYEGSRHELLRESDKIREKVLTDVFAFLETGT